MLQRKQKNSVKLKFPSLTLNKLENFPLKVYCTSNDLLEFIVI